MQKFMQLELFRLAEIPQNEAHTSQLEESYDEFALKVLTRLHLETNPAEIPMPTANTTSLPAMFRGRASESSLSSRAK